MRPRSPAATPCDSSASSPRSSRRHPEARGDTVTDPGPWCDKLAIREVIEQYMRWNDDGDFASIVGLFTKDATFQFFGRVLVGRNAISEFFAGMFPPPRPHWTEGGSLFVQPRSLHISS